MTARRGPGGPGSAEPYPKGVTPPDSPPAGGSGPAIATAFRTLDDHRAAVARVRHLHHVYRPAHVDTDTCGHCNQLHEWPAVEPWPCPTIRALNGDRA